MTQDPPREDPRQLDPSDPAWVDHILAQLTSRPVPAGPDVESAAPPPAPEPPAAPPETPEADPAAEPMPSPVERSASSPIGGIPEPSPLEPPGGLLDELASPDPPAARPAPSVREPRPIPEPLPGMPAPAAAPPPPPIPPPAPRRVPRRGTLRGDPLLSVGAPERPAPPLPAGRRRRRVTAAPQGSAPYDDDDYDAERLEEFDERLEESRSPMRTLVGWIVTVAIAIALSLLIRSFVAHAFHVESGSMEPTLTPGDRILVNKLSDNPSRGDLVVFGRPDGDLIKRVIALEGETVIFEDGLIRIGEKWLREPYLSAGIGTYAGAAIPNCDPTHGFAGREACTVPEGHVFVLGDNRDVSFDSRNFGPVPRADLVGSAALQFWPLGDLRGL